MAHIPERRSLRRRLRPYFTVFDLPLTLILAMDQIDDPVRSGDLLAFVQGGGYIIASLSPLAAGLLRDRLSDLSQAWMLMGLGLVAMALMTLTFRPGGAKLR